MKKCKEITAKTLKDEEIKIVFAMRDPAKKRKLLSVKGKGAK